MGDSTAAAWSGDDSSSKKRRVAWRRVVATPHSPRSSNALWCVRAGPQPVRQERTRPACSMRCPAACRSRTWSRQGPSGGRRCPGTVSREDAGNNTRDACAPPKPRTRNKELAFFRPLAVLLQPQHAAQPFFQSGFRVWNIHTWNLPSYAVATPHFCCPATA